MYLKNDKITVTIKNVVMRSSRNTMKNQLILDPTAITGWDDGTAVRRDASVRPVSNGDFSERATMGARTITLSGVAIAENPLELQKLRDQLIGVLADGYYSEMEVSTGGGVRYALVGLEGTPSWTQQLDTVAAWRLELYAPDPRIYGPLQSMTVGQSKDFGGGQKYILTYPLQYGSAFTQTIRATLSNNGNVEAYPTFIITGEYPTGFRVYDNADHEVIYNGQVSMAAPVEIDMGRGTAIQNGVDKTVLVSKRQWFSISPGEIIRPSFKALTSGTGWCDILYRDTWI
jgi:hypothetical protein